MSFPKISFCTGCMGRLHHLREVFLDNVIFNCQTYPQVEFVLLDYNSQDGLEDWVRRNLWEFIEAGIVVYLKERTRTHWNMSHAKNVAHLAASGEIVCNVDADNRIVPDFACHLAALFAGSQCIVAAPPPVEFSWETSGRVAIRKADFCRLGGYNEEFVGGYGLEDHELIVRAQRAGLVKKTWGARFDDVIRHDNHERGKHLPMAWGASCHQSEQIHEETLRGSNTVANAEREWGVAEVACNLGATIRTSSDFVPAIRRRNAATTDLQERMSAVLEERRGILADPHLTGRVATRTGGTLQFYVRLGRAPGGAVLVSSATFETDDPAIVLPAGLVVRLANGRPLPRVRSVDLGLFSGELANVDRSIVADVTTAWQTTLAGLS